MLSFGLKVTWFSLSLAGLFSSWAVVPTFTRATKELWMPLFYCVANTVLQGIFCLGLIWRMDPFRMPHPFCMAQAVLIHATWACMAGICTAITISTASRVFRDSSLLAQFARRAMFFRIALVIGFPCIVLVAAAVSMNVLNAARPVDGLQCDASFPSWVRLLGYAGVTLLLTVPSLTLSFITVVQVTRLRPDSNREEVHLSPSHHDALTYLPVRRTRRKSYRTPNTLLSAHDHPTSIPSSIDQTLFSPMPTVCAIPSGPESSSTVVPPGRARVLVGRSRYHLPFDWMETRYSPDDFREFYSNEHMRVLEPSHITNPSPIRFSSPSEISSTKDSIRVISPADIEKDSIRLNIYTGVLKLPDSDDTINGSLELTRRSADSSGVKSVLVFAKYDEDDGDYSVAGIGYEDMSLPFQLPVAQQSSSTHNVWPSLAFQILLSITQIVGVISSVVDIATQSPSPTPFGTQHVALLLAAWGPCMVFGVFAPFGGPARMG